jgi:hypothetical protein
MRKLLVVAGLATVLTTNPLDSFAQLDLLFAPFDCREHAEYYQEASLAAEPIVVDSSLIVSEEIVVEKEIHEPFRSWNVVENFAFGKDRGELTMIADLNALHPFFRDQVRELIVRCKAKGVELAIVETYRTHAKQNEYRSMGRKYTNSTGGKSKHQYGLAVDVVPVVNGMAVWDNVLLWKKVGLIGEKLGLRWGGRWKKPYDPGHFEWTGGLSSTHLSSGQAPRIPQDRYPCIEEDLAELRSYWRFWEDAQQQALAEKISARKVN